MPVGRGAFVTSDDSSSQVNSMGIRHQRIRNKAPPNAEHSAEVIHRPEKQVTTSLETWRAGTAPRLFTSEAPQVSIPDQSKTRRVVMSDKPRPVNVQSKHWVDNESFASQSFSVTTDDESGLEGFRSRGYMSSSSSVL